MSYRLIAAALLLLAGPAVAQDAPAAPADTPPAEAAAPAVPDVAEAPADTPASDAPAIAFDPGPIEACLSAAGDPAGQSACIGAATAACVEAAAIPNTMIQGACAGAELDWWKARLNQTYDQLAAAHAETDAAVAAVPGGAPQAGKLEASQKAWLAWRDADCAYVESFMAGGSAAGPLRLSCETELTGRRAIDLGFRLKDTAR